jgi:hypothetical protein
VQSVADGAAGRVVACEEEEADLPDGEGAEFGVEAGGVLLPRFLGGRLG